MAWTRPSAPYVKRGKNDAADAEALCEAASRPTMRYVPAKTTDQQAALMLASARERLVNARTQLGNAIRGHAAEFGLIAAKGASHVADVLALVAADATIPAVARTVFDGLAEDYAHLETRLCHGGCRAARLAQNQRAGQAPHPDPRRGCRRLDHAGDENALANKIARVAWKLMASGEAYDMERAQPKLAAA